MSGIGEASAVIGVVQVGFSLARTLNTYIGDYKDSRDSIISLASELDATIIQVKELNSLVGNSKTASEGSKKLAEKCIKDSDRLVKRLVELLTKARLPEDPQAIISISPGDIIPSRLTKAYWPFVKPQVDVVKSELQVMKTDILIARSCIQSQSAATAADRTAGEESIVALARSRVTARKLLREAMAEEKRSIAAMQDSVFEPNTALVQIPAPNGVDNNTQGGGAVPSPPSKPPALDSREPNADDVSGNTADDARITKLAQDIQASVQAELARKDEERKANQTAEEAVKKSAVEAYQKSIGDRLERLLQNTEATQRLLKEVFGADLDQEKVKKFLVEQQSQQLRKEFGDMLSQFGVRPPVLHGDIDVGTHTGPTRPDVVPLSRRRWFFKRQFPRYSYGYGVDSSRASSTISRSRRGSSVSNDAVDFLHIAVSFDLGEGKHSFQSYDHTILKHKPCGPDCDLQTTMRLWQTLPESVKQSVSKWVEETYSVKESDWNLHSAIPVAKNTPRTRRLLQRLVLGATSRETTGSILLILGPSERPRRLGSSTDSVRTVSSSASSSKPTSKDVKKLQAELAELTAELKALRAAQVDAAVGADAHMPPIKFKDAVGRKFSFAWHICKTWKGMESLIKQSFLHVDVIGPHVQEGHYDLMGPDGTIILPQLWDTMVRPDWEVTMYMWPMPEPLPKKDKKTKKTNNPVIEPPINYDPIGEPAIGEPFAGVNLHEFMDLDPSTSIAERRAAKKKSKDKSKASNPFGGPILEAYPPMPSEPPQAIPISVEMPPMASKPPQSAPVVIDMPTRMRNAILEERIREFDRENFSQRHSTRSAKKIVPEVRHASAKDFNAGGGRISPKERDHVHTKEYVLDEPTAFPEDSDAEDALLDDEALKNKMLMKYAGGVEAVDGSEAPAGRSSQDQRQEMLNEERRSRAYRSRSVSPVSRRSRERVATFEEGRANNGDDNDIEW